MSSSFQTIQHQFAHHLKGGAVPDSLKAVEPRRLNVYRELFFNNVKGFVDAAYPVLASLYSETEWQQEIRDFWQLHDCQTPYFLGIAEEFLSYLAEERQPKPNDFPFLLELAHYEWVELAIATRKTEQPQAGYAAWLDNESHMVAVSELAWSLSYRFPVHYISPDYLPDTPAEQGIFLIVYRDSDDEVRFMEINGLTAHMLHLIQQAGKLQLSELKTQLIQTVPQIAPQQLQASLAQILTQLGQKGILIRTK